MILYRGLAVLMQRLEKWPNFPANFADIMAVNVQESVGYFALHCGPCGGAGRKVDNTPCGVCRGEGSIVLSGTLADYADCRNCAGSGYTGFHVNAICKFCDGVGAVKKPSA